MKIRSGSRRIVFVFKDFVIKIPKITSWKGFIFGILENLEERYWLVADNTKHLRHSWDYPLAKIHYADRFGFCVVMERADIFPLEELKKNFPISYQKAVEWGKVFPFYNDIKDGNLGLVRRRVVFVDYGFSQDSTYLANPVYVVHNNDTGESHTTLLWKFTEARRAAMSKVAKALTVFGGSLLAIKRHVRVAYKQLDTKIRG